MITLADMLDTIEHIARIRSITQPIGPRPQSVDDALTALSCAIAKQIEDIAADLPKYIHATAHNAAQEAEAKARWGRSMALASKTGIPGA